jgi:hypothetical protein
MIADRQNDPNLLTSLAAARRYYDLGQRWHRLRVTGTIGFVALGVVVTFWYHGAAVYIAAAAGGWILFARTMFDYLERRAFVCGAKAQEQFDCELFSLPWNNGLAGNPLSAEHNARAARRYKRKRPTKLHDWYPADVDKAAWPSNVILCQRASAAWARRTHSAYTWAVGTSSLLWLLATMVIGAAAHASLAEYLIRLFLPSQPALMDSVDLVRTHWLNAGRKARVENRAEQLLMNASASESDSRSLQDQIFEIRQHPPRVPDWFYRLRRRRDEEAMRDAVAAWLQRIP